jgi:Mrp family chromosome partitioning ATPase
LIDAPPQRTLDDWRVAIDTAMGAATWGRTPFGWRFVDDCATAFRWLRSQLPENTVIAVVSAERGDGRSAVAAGLALGIARSSEASVGLLDLDFEHPVQSRIFFVAPAPGLSDYLIDGTPLRAVSIRGNSRLCVLPAGARRGQGAWLLRELAAGGLLDACRQRFTWTVVDLPPVLENPDATLLADLADAYLLVGHHRRTKIGDIEAAARLVPAGRPTGFVMTAAASSAPSRQPMSTATLNHQSPRS